MAGLSVLPEMDVTQFVHKHSTLNKNQIILISPLIFLFFSFFFCDHYFTAEPLLLLFKKTKFDRKSFTVFFKTVKY